MTSKASPLRITTAWVGIVLAAAVVGALSSRPLLTFLMDRQAAHNGPWRSSATTGSPAANPWQRAAVALAGLYALNPSEAIYFTAFTDSAGVALRGECRYLVTGSPPPARWWSLTAYGVDHYLVPNAANRYARHAGNLPAPRDGRFKIAVSAQPPADIGLPSPPQGPFSLTLRLYNSAPQVLGQLATLPLPRITREGCP